MKIYNVFHCYDVDGGFGEAIPKKILIGSFESKEDAGTVVALLSNPHVYKPYSELECGVITIEETEIVSHSEFNVANFDPKNYWWTKICEDDRNNRSMRNEWRCYINTKAENDCITEYYFNSCAYIIYKTGTPCAEIEKWFDENYPGGVAALKSLE